MGFCNDERKRDDRLEARKTSGAQTPLNGKKAAQADPGIQAAAAAKAGYDRIKRVLDTALALMALIVLLPALLIVCAVIVIDDPHGGPIYVSERIGQNGRPFRFYKFRSMYVGAEERLAELMQSNEADGPAFKMRDDPRMTRVGRVLRKYSIDELPQLLNVIKGDMSLVGPRPPLPREVAQYTPRQAQRLSIRPGLTCIWQTQPQRNRMSFDEWIELDIEYIYKRGFWLDCALIFRTIRVMVTGEGA